MRRIFEWGATWFFVGKFPWAPGTIGTLAGFPVVFLFSTFGTAGYLGCTLLFVILAIFFAHGYQLTLSRHDSPEIVIDEVAGILITMAAVPLSWVHCGLGFLLFRILDIWKPPPIRWCDEKIGGGVGVVADDVVAGLVANVLLQLFQFGPGGSL